jgi:hypothetical protein
VSNQPPEEPNIALGEGQDVWGYVDLTLAEQHPAGFTVEAQDGKIGKVDKASNEPGSSYLVVDTGPWILGKKVIIPAGLIERVDRDSETVFVSRTKDEIKEAPEYDPQVGVGEVYRNVLGGYYGSRPAPTDEPLRREP